MKAQIFNFSSWVSNTSPQELFDYYQNLLVKSGFSVLDVVEKHFEPFGYTALFLLGESHFAIHTFPESGETYIELSSCVKTHFDTFVKEYAI